MSPILTLENVSKRFGGLFAVKELNLDLSKGEFLGLIGPNGAGKTTLMNLITGEHNPTSGVITYRGKDISKSAPHQVCKMGISRTFQIPRPFPKLKVIENVLVSALYGKGGRWHAAEDKAMDCLDLVGLKDKYSMRAAELQFVDLRRLELARALAAEPEILLMDELAAGLSDSEIPAMLSVFDKIREMGMTVILIEHILKIVVGAVDRVVVLDQGSKIAEGRPDEVMNDDRCIKAYLGKAEGGQVHPAQEVAH